MAESELAVTLADADAEVTAPSAELAFRPKRRAAARRAPKTLGLIHPARDVAPSEAPALALAENASSAVGVVEVEQDALRDQFRQPEPVAFDDVPFRPPNTPGELPLFVKGMPAQAAPDLDDIALAALSRPPRAPLSVRRTIPELVRPRPASVTPPRKLGPIHDDLMEDLSRVEAEEGVQARAAARAQARLEREVTGEASPRSRLAALGADWGLLAAIGAVILWSSLRVAGVGLAALDAPALIPLAAFLVLVHFGYFLLFTVAGGQTPGKMVVGIRVVDATGPSARVHPPSLKQAAYRALLAAASGLFLGAGLPARAWRPPSGPARTDDPDAHRPRMTPLGVYVATVGGTGHVPFAPGTAGSAVGLGIYLAMHYLGMPASFQIGLTVAIIIGGTWAAGEAARHFQQEDPGQVVVDEVAGQLVTLVLTGAALKGALVGFLVFRALDVIKPWPSSRFERLHGGIGIMADDVMVALYGNLILQAILHGPAYSRYPDLI